MSDTSSINPLDYGVLPTGFSRMRLPEIRQAIIDSLQAKTQLTFETRPDSITGQFIDVFAEREATIWELAQAVYHAMYPISAFGVNLDHSVAFAGVTRLFALQSLVWVNMYGTQGTVIAAGAVVRSETSREDFVLQEDVTIDVNAAGHIQFSVDTAVVGNTYSITLYGPGGDVILDRYIAVAGDTNVIIANKLSDQLISANYVVTTDANTIHVYRVDGISFQALYSAGISIILLGSTGLYKAVNYGTIEIPVNDITQIVTTQTGWDSANNVTVGQSGRDVETDDQLRQRYTNGVYLLGAATLQSIQANLENNILGLINVSVYENDTGQPDADGRPPHTIEVVANGGDPQSIGEEIYRVKSAGIDTYGDVQIDVSDSAGYNHVIRFNRPIPVYIWANVQVTKYSEEIFPGNGSDLIKQIMVDTGNAFGVGKDIIHQRFMGPLYSQISGMSSIIISTAITYDSTITPALGDYTADNKSIAIRELSRFSIDRISVVII